MVFCCYIISIPKMNLSTIFTNPLYLLLYVFIFRPLLCTAQAKARVPYIDNGNMHNSPSRAFVFTEAKYSKCLLVTVPCGSLNRFTTKESPYAIETWTNVTLKAGEPLHVEFGYPYFRRMWRQAFRPTLWIIGPGLPPYPPPGNSNDEEEECDPPPSPLPPGIGAIVYPLSDDNYFYAQKVIYYEPFLQVKLLSLLNVTEAAKQDGVYSFVLTSKERRRVRVYLTVGEKEVFVFSQTPPADLNLNGLATAGETKAWARGTDVRGLGRFCRRRWWKSGWILA